MKKSAALLIGAVIAVTASIMSTAFAEREVSVKLNGEALEFDAAPFIENDRTLVPVRKIFESVGANVQWDDSTKTAFAVREKNGEMTVISIQINSDTAFINDTEVTLDTAALIVNDRTFVPLRFVMEALGEKVEWDDASSTVLITME